MRLPVPGMGSFAPSGVSLPKTIYGEVTHNRAGIKDIRASFPAKLGALGPAWPAPGPPPNNRLMGQATDLTGIAVADLLVGAIVMKAMSCPERTLRSGYRPNRVLISLGVARTWRTNALRILCSSRKP
jgi:hypothetical protein